MSIRAGLHYLLWYLGHERVYPDNPTSSTRRITMPTIHLVGFEPTASRLSVDNPHESARGRGQVFERGMALWPLSYRCIVDVERPAVRRMRGPCSGSREIGRAHV